MKSIFGAAVVGCLAPAPALAGDDWVGLFQALDPVDGSVNLMSIAPDDHGGYQIVVVVPDHAKCGGPGVVVAEGRLEGRSLMRENAVLRCDGAEEIAHSEAEYHLDADEEMIMIDAPIDGRRLHYFRIGGDG